MNTAECVETLEYRCLPAISVTGNGVLITNGSATPSSSNATSFGAVTLGSSAAAVYTISNSGPGTIHLGQVTATGSHAGDFVVTAQPTAALAPGASTTFTVEYRASQYALNGAETATLSFTEDDTTVPGPYSFNVSGTGSLPASGSYAAWYPHTFVIDATHSVTGDGVSWSDPYNWSSNQIPVDGMDVYLGNSVTTADVSGTFHSIVGRVATVSLGSGSVAVDANSAFRDLQISGGIFSFYAPTTVTAGQLEFTGGQLYSNGTLAVAGHMTWAGGAISGGTNISVASGLEITSLNDATPLLGNAVLTLNGNSVWNGNNLNVMSSPGSGRFVNYGTFDLQTDGTVNINPGSSGAVLNFDNYGTLQKSQNAGDADWSAAAVNLKGGTVNILTGSISVGKGGQISGQGMTVSGDGRLKYMAGMVTLVNNASVTGGNGYLEFSGSTLAIPNNVSASLAHLALTNGQLNGMGNLTVSQGMLWSGGTITGGGLLNITGLQIADAGDGHTPTLVNRQVTLAGNSTWTGNTLSVDGGTITNNGTLDLQGDFAIVPATTGITWNNVGTLRKSAGSGIADWNGVTFTNSGVTEIQAGTLKLHAGYLQTAGTTTVQATAVLNPGGTATIQAGLLNGSGIIAGDVVNQGTVSPGSTTPGTLTIQGNYTQSAAARLEIDLQGTTLGSTYDQLAVTGTLQMGGTLQINTVAPFAPAVDDAFIILSYGSRQSDFSTVNGLELGHGRFYVPTVGTTQYTLVLDSRNVPPSFTAGPAQTVLEDAGPQTRTGWATNLDAGTGTTLQFVVTNDNPGLFAAAPAIDTTGKLTFTPAADANGSATVTVILQSPTGDVDGSVEVSPPQTFVITVTAVNDPPAFAMNSSLTVLEDSGAQTFADWATGLSAGPANEAAQGLSFIVTNNNNALFAAQPAISAQGTLTFTLAAHATGSAVVTVRLQDSGGTTNGGSNFVEHTFTLQVDPVNHPPVASPQSVELIQDHALPITLTGTDGDTAVVQTLTFAIVTAPAHGTLVLTNATLGTVTYTPNAGYVGPDLFTFQITDDNQLPTGPLTSAPATVSITVNATPVVPPALTLGGSDVSWVKKQSSVALLPQVAVAGSELGNGVLTLVIQAGKIKSKMWAANFMLPSTSQIGTAGEPQFTSSSITLTIQLGPHATAAAIQNFLRGIKFGNGKKGAIKNHDWNIKVTLTSADQTSAMLTQTLHVSKK